jgi:hypothetical protein
MIGKGGVAPSTVVVGMSSPMPPTPFADHRQGRDGKANRTGGNRMAVATATLPRLMAPLEGEAVTLRNRRMSQLNVERRDRIRAALRASPGLSNRTLAKQLGLSRYLAFARRTTLRATSRFMTGRKA